MSGILILKLNIASSGCINFRKVLKNPLGQAEVDWRGIVYNNSWQDLYGHSFDVENNKLTVKNVRIKSKNLKKMICYLKYLIKFTITMNTVTWKYLN